MMNRRQFLHAIGGTAGVLAVGGFSELSLIRPRFATDPFTLGVASGDPTASGVVLWTRLAPEPLLGGGMGASPVEVKWMIWADEAMKKTVQQGVTRAEPAFNHSVHVEAEGLEAGREYWYRFESGGVQSPIGRTKTAPKPGERSGDLKFAFASCQNWPAGRYAAYLHMAEQDLDIVFHLGDYIYEGKLSSQNLRGLSLPQAVQSEPTTLEQYRLRYALYKMDPQLQAAHAAHPFMVTWDDHEVDNNYANDIDQDNSDPSSFLKRRAAAYQAYYENMPLRRAQLPHGPDLLLYRRLVYGDLAQFDVLDGRQYRSDQVKRANVGQPGRTMLGKTQDAWLREGLKEGDATWKIIPQQTWMCQVRGVNGTSSTDNWNGYTSERHDLLEYLDEAKIANAVVLTGDSHKNMVGNLKVDFDDPKSATVGAELAGTAISSGGISDEEAPKWAEAIAAQPHIEWFEGQKRGYVTCGVNRDRITSDYWAVEDVKSADSAVTKAKSFVIQNGIPGVVSA